MCTCTRPFLPATSHNMHTHTHTHTPSWLYIYTRVCACVPTYAHAHLLVCMGHLCVTTLSFCAPPLPAPSFCDLSLCTKRRSNNPRGGTGAPTDPPLSPLCRTPTPSPSVLVGSTHTRLLVCVLCVCRVRAIPHVLFVCSLIRFSSVFLRPLVLPPHCSPPSTRFSLWRRARALESVRWQRPPLLAFSIAPPCLIRRGPLFRFRRLGALQQSARLRAEVVCRLSSIRPAPKLQPRHTCLIHRLRIQDSHNLATRRRSPSPRATRTRVTSATTLPRRHRH